MRVEGGFRTNREGAFRGMIAESAPTHERFRKFKTAILDQLGIQPAIGAQVDILEEDAPHRRIDPGAGPVDLDSDPDGFRCPGLGERQAVKQCRCGQQMEPAKSLEAHAAV